MTGDFSRVILGGSTYARVLMQQGRVQLDSDWNEAAAIADERTRTALADIFGGSGVFGPAVVPADAPGFGIRVHAGLRFDGAHTYLRMHRAPHLRGRRAFTVAVTVAPHAGGHGGCIISRLNRERHGAYGEFALSVTPEFHVRFAWIERGHRRWHRDERPAAFAPGERLVEKRSEPESDEVGILRVVESIDALEPERYSDIRVVAERGTLEIWIDGRFSGSGRIERVGEHGDEVPFLIGADLRRGRPVHFFDGIIDQLSIRHHARRRHGLRGAEAAEFRHRLHAGWLDTERDAQRCDAGAGRWPVPVAATIAISAGRAYVDGTLCINPAPTDLGRQPLAPDVAMPADRSIPYLAYLDVWERIVNADQDPALRDPALRGIDTTVRVQTIPQVRLAPLDAADRVLRSRISAGRLTFAYTPEFAPPDNRLVRVEIHHSGVALDPAPTWHGTDAVECDVDASGLILIPEESVDWSIGQTLQVIATDGSATLAHVVAAAPAEITVDTPFEAPVRVRALASVKWSLDNAWLTLPAVRISPDGGSITLDVTTERRAAVGDVRAVEVIDDARILSRRPGAFIPSVTLDDESDADTIAFDPSTVVGTLPEIDARARSLIRLWDPFADAAAGALRIVDPGSSLPLLYGLRATLAAGSYRCGDAWTIPVRVDTDYSAGGTIGPSGPDANGERVAPLAIIRFAGEPRVEDLRRYAGALDRVEVPYDPRRPDDRPHPPPPPPPECRCHHECRCQDQGHRNEIVLTREPEPPAGYRSAHAVVAAQTTRLRWRDLDERAPLDGPALAVGVDHRIFVYFEAHQRLFRFEPRGRDDERWSECEAPPFPPDRGAAFVAAGRRVFLAGGYRSRNRLSDRFDEYDIANGHWIAHPRMPGGRARFAAAAVGGQIVLAGGIRRNIFGFRQATSSVVAFDLDRASWSSLPRLPSRRYGMCAVEIDGAVCVVAGARERTCLPTERFIRRIDALVPLPGERWTGRAALRFSHQDARIVRTDDALYVFGGRGYGTAASPDEHVALRADPRALPEKSIEEARAGIAWCDGAVYAIGGLRHREHSSAVRRLKLTEVLYAQRRADPDDNG